MKNKSVNYSNEEMLFALYDTGNGTVVHLIPVLAFNGREVDFGPINEDGKSFNVADLEKYGINKNTPCPGLFVVKLGRDIVRLATLLIDDGFRSTDAFTEFTRTHFDEGERPELLKKLVAKINSLDENGEYVKEEEHDCEECGECSKRKREGRAIPYHVMIIDENDSGTIQPTILVRSATSKDDAIEQARQAIVHILERRGIETERVALSVVPMDDDSIIAI